MNMHTTIPPAATAAAIWADACAIPGAIERNPAKFLRLAELLARFERDDIERAVDLLLESLDLMDGDADTNAGSPAELPIERFWRDARVERIWEGPSELHRDIIAKDVLREFAA